MKKLAIVLSVLTISAFTFSCSDKFDEIDTNPNSTDKPLTYGIFNSANKEFADNYRGVWISGRMILPWVQYSAQTGYTEEDRYRYRLPPSGDALWSISYRVAQDYKKIILLNTDPATKEQMAVYGPNVNQIAAARVMLAYVFLNLVDSYGDVPYYSYGNPDPDFQALDVDKNLQPKFASQQKIYTDLLKELKESAAMIDVNGKVFTQGDRLFGSGLKLKKFANSLRLRIATRVKGVIPGADAQIADAIASGVMTSNADNVGLTYENNLVNPSPFFNDFRTRTDFAISKTFVQLLKGQKGLIQQDPRLFKYASPVGTTQTAIVNGTSVETTDPAKIAGMPYGVASTVSASQEGTYSYFSKNILKPDYTEILMEYSEVQFLLSEANGWSQINYINGVKASMERWGVPSADITTYVNSLPAANQENVITQKYIALFMQPFEAWAEYRRTGFPKTLLLPGQTADLNVPTTTGQSTYTFTSLIDGLTDLPTRIFYPTTVQNLNTENYKAASAAIGGDKMNTKLIWDKN
ncbi:SusD/RagB family nutrient-binding outer membrane lipoprotein [Elizabethkingia anophelis]|uniref:SusD/RagB family nutrient-binding outer membrane lipoprotein n=1 Tax=Elizabethkingia anophelis TaxID=1117645 RepID=UPI00099A14EC|nr:SusD/RagB family nutrient-binding outer membrane lipoprotein [Elizabethkingia anophelis]MCT4011028.1 SusD/RagB family nutrient-binding outer membrane lipoprotein [Elizabethkingia anophelis]MDV3896624.1 SusD/RagB family nutrient-binding outer membrane lipoprotein [Elizabethkingia anophelis]OPC50972.1 hypothetical protein BAY06_07310 [Elizabethkingia anophelis]